MYIIVGLGNPGKKYERTRHNMGFLALDLIADKYGIDIGKLKFRALLGEGRIGDEKVLLVKPQTYMNLSGEAVREVMNFYKVPMDHLIVIYDDLDLPQGTIRIRASGSSGTHNGMRNVIYCLGDEGFPRIRVGIGGNDRDDLIDYVTGRITEKEADPLWNALNKAAEAAPDIVLNGVGHAMQEFNIKPRRLRKLSEEEEEQAK
ncbi:MAG: aminoacyl-tRNA hydrolase [Clostridia bacterium]|jgi:PTH1 family peptidyl-tRNA hydrolase|nr:aminoacyl-tRNA hydrolase [Clostridia bacterium]